MYVCMYVMWCLAICEVFSQQFVRVFVYPHAVLSMPMDAVSTAGSILQSTSMGGPMTLLPSSSSSPCTPGLPPASSGTTSSKAKVSRNSSHPNGGQRKRTPPTPSAGGSLAKKSQQYMLVAAEAVPLKDAGMCGGDWGSTVEPLYWGHQENLAFIEGCPYLRDKFEVRKIL